MRPNIFKLKKIQEQKEHAYYLYTQGKSFREIGKFMNKSYTWAWLAINELTKDKELLDNTKHNLTA